jgi:hypothetical protein
MFEEPRPRFPTLVADIIFVVVFFWLEILAKQGQHQ